MTSGSDCDMIDRDLRVRMQHGWYTGRNTIRTRGTGIRIRIRGDGFQGKTLVPFTIISDDVQMIIKNIDSIDKCFDNMTLKKGIVPVSFCKPVEEENHAIMIQQLGLGIAEHLHGKPEIFRLVFQFLQNGGG